MKKHIQRRNHDFILNANMGNSDPESGTNFLDTKANIFESIEKNKNYLESLYNAKINSDFILREFFTILNSKKIKAFIAYFDGMTDVNSINDFTLRPLMYRTQKSNPKSDESMPLETYISECLVVQNDISEAKTFSEVTSAINSGNCVLFVDTLPFAFNIDAKNFKQRSVSEPKNESIIKGPQNAFVENIRTNTSLLRQTVNNENLVIENIPVGKLSQTKCGVCYLKNIANSDLVAEVKYRLSNLEIDTLLSSGELEQLLEDPTYFGLPTIISTERPDKCYKYLFQGRVVVIINGNPYALIMPGTIVDFVFSPEDSNLKPIFANFLRGLRFLAILISLLLPGIYIATTNFNQDLLPTELLLSIITSRESVPFPIIVELLILEISFEIIREAAIRVPSAIGSTLGIVGGLILGDAAVSANIVSNILVIIVAITGIASFAIPDFSFGFHFRIMRFVFIFLGYITGFLGISVGLFVYVSLLCSINSFGVPYSLPFAPAIDNSNQHFFISYFWRQEHLENITNPKKKFAESKISKLWRYKEQ